MTARRRTSAFMAAGGILMCLLCSALIGGAYLWVTSGSYQTPTPHFYVTGVHLTSGIDANGFPVDQIDGYPEGTSEAIICLAGNAGVPVTFTAKWFHQGDLLAESSIPVTGYVGCLGYRPDSGTLLPGIYSVEVYVDDVLERVVEFSVGVNVSATPPL